MWTGPDRHHHPVNTGASSEAAFFHEVMTVIAEAERLGDHTEIESQLKRLADRNPQLRLLAEESLRRTRDVRARTEAGQPLPVYPVGMNLPGQRLCDFCTTPDPTWYYQMHEFSIASDQVQFLSGDRMYACDFCRSLVDANDWKKLRTWVGPTSSAMTVRLLWMGFKQNRYGDPVPVPPGTDPEEGRE